MTEEDEEEMLAICQEPVNVESRGLTDISTMKRQLQLLSIMPGIKLEIKDCTDDPQIPAVFKSGLLANPGSTLIFMENILAPGRMYKVVATKTVGAQSAFQDLGRNIFDPVAANRTYTTNAGTSVKKRWGTLIMSFWTTIARAVPSVLARNIVIYARYRDPPTGTTWRVPLRNLAANVAGNVVICGDPESFIELGNFWEYEVEYGNPGAPGIFVDTIWMLEVK